MRWMKVWGGVRAATPMVGATLALLTLSGCPAAEGGGEDQGLGQLGESCSASGECLDGFECVGQICTNACVDDFGCALGFRCDGGFCAQDSNGNGQIGDVCERDGDCGGELRCFEDPQDGRFCVQTCDLGGNDCPPGQPCVPVTGDLGYCDFDANPNNDPNNQPNNEPNNDPNNDPNNNPNNDPNNDPNNNPGCDPPCAGDETCINGVCVPDEEESCEQAGQSCTAETVDGNGLTCVVADNTDEARTCRATCTQDEQCGQGEFCGEPVGAGVRVCLPGNCTSILSSAEECTGVGANGGTCVLRRPGVFYCLAAGTGALEAQCGSEADCGAGLGCVQGGCAQPCPEGDDGACGQAAACVAANVASEPGVGICQAQDPGCENVDQVCQGAEDDRAELICAVGNPLAPQLQTCLSACEPGAQDCPQGQLCASLQRDGQSVTACVASNCNSALAPDQCAGIGPDGGNCLPAGNGALRCVSAGQGQDGAACADERQCAAGLGCDGSFCRPLCQLGAPDACAPGSVCQETLGDDVFGTCTPGECDPVCGVGQTCFRGECVDDGACQAIGQPCDDQTADGDGLLCVLGDSLDEEAATCHRVCDVDFDDCPSGSVCVDLDDDTGVCLRSNCDSPVESQAQCGAIDGTCLPLGNQTYFCAAAGDAAEGQACEATADCAAGLGCLQGECSPMCSVEPDTCGQERCVTIFNDEDFGVCGDGCPGFQQEGACGPDQGCLPLSNDNGLCVDVGPRQAGEPCNPDAPGQECGEFLSCVNLGEQGQVCQPWCNLTLENPEIGCADNELCLDAFDGLDAVGLCFPECTPFAPVGQNGCEIDGFQSCIPQNGPDEGVCQASGDTPAGENCLNNGSILGDCQAGLACLTEGEQLVGVCEPLCRTFSSVGNFESGCGAGQVCEIFGQDFGVCSDNVLPGNLQAGDSCPTAGQWCSDDTLCLGVGVDENLCLTLCRSREGDADCPQGQACELGIFDGDVFGLCL